MYLLILNPASGRRHHAKLLEYVSAWFKARNLSLEVRLTTRPGHAREMAEAAAHESKWTAVIAAGGDGTINEVVNGLAGSHTPLGILPWGTTNVFSMEMGYPRRLSAQCRTIVAQRTLRLDLGRANGQAFLMMAGIGFDAYALRRAGSLKQRLGPLAYALAAFRSLLRFRYPVLTFRNGNGKERQASYLLASNTSRYGGLFVLSPKASPFDGRLELYTYRERGRFRLLKLGISLVASLFSPDSRFRRRFFYMREGSHAFTDIYIQSDQTVWYQLDGDLAGQLPLRITCDPAAIDIIVPARTWRRNRRGKGLPSPG